MSEKLLFDKLTGEEYLFRGSVLGVETISFVEKTTKPLVCGECAVTVFPGNCHYVLDGNDKGYKYSHVVCDRCFKLAQECQKKIPKFYWAFGFLHQYLDTGAFKSLVSLDVVEAPFCLLKHKHISQPPIFCKYYYSENKTISSLELNQSIFTMPLSDNLMSYGAFPIIIDDTNSNKEKDKFLNSLELTTGYLGESVEPEEIKQELLKKLLLFHIQLKIVRLLSV